MTRYKKSYHKLSIQWFTRFILIATFIAVTSFYAKAAEKRALLIGISDYPTVKEHPELEWNDIHGANDVAILTPALQKHGFKTTSIINQEATAKNIRKQLAKFSSTLKAGDIIYLHFSCHGQPVEDLDGDEADGWDEAIIPVDAQKVYSKVKYKGENHITDDELNRLFRTIRTKIGRKGYLTVVIDACHAGTSYRGEESEDSVFVRGTNCGFSERGLKFVPKIDKRGRIRVERSDNMSNICIIEACRSYQVNNEIKCDGKYYGSLSYYTNKVLQSNNSIEWRKPWYDDIIKLMSKDVRLIRQNPVIEISE